MARAKRSSASAGTIDPPGHSLGPPGLDASIVDSSSAAARDITARRLIDAPNPKEAEALFAVNPAQFNLLVTDVIMPGSSGPRLFERLVQFRPDLRVLYVSGYADDTIVYHGQLLPGVELLQKPFTAAQLNRRVREVIDR